ncbi:MAG: thiosulfate oxidation carrier complex protein SoxZ [Gammaproteobacteria bacterium]|nr:thiosulfate oxidation carrier complex protein SoxZ [Gammaproteobacteria bacterium]
MRVNIVNKNGQANIRVLIKHPMETGMRKDKGTGKVVPAHFIQTLKIEHKGQVVIDAKCGVAVSKDPFFYFKVGGVAAGDAVKITWKDNLGKSESKDETVA